MKYLVDHGAQVDAKNTAGMDAADARRWRVRFEHEEGVPGNRGALRKEMAARGLATGERASAKPGR